MTTAPTDKLMTESHSALARTNPNELATAQLQAQAIAFEQAAFIVAYQRPRDMDVVRQKLLKECDRTSFAATAIYRKPVGATTVTGLSIRYAEAALNLLGNARTKRIVTLDDLTRRKIMIVVSDLESNTHYEAEITIEKTVERRSLKEGQNPLGSRLNSKGERVYLVEATEDDMLTKESAIASKFIRQNALRLVPGWLQDECYDAIMATQKKKAAADPDAEKNKIMDAFSDLGVRADQVKQYLRVDDLAALTPKDLIELRAIYQGIKDGETNWREVMEQRDAALGKQAAAEGGSAAAGVTEKLKTFNQAKSPVQAPQTGDTPVTPTPAPETPQKPTVTQEQAPQEASAKPESPVLEIVTQEVLVVDVETRTKAGKTYMLLNCKVDAGGDEKSDFDLALFCWHKNTMFEHLKGAIDKACVFGIVRHEDTKQDKIWWNIEAIERIGDVMFEGGKPLASPKDLFTQK